MPSINPEILKWARETAGLTPAAAVEKLRLVPARGKSAIERLAALETGEDEPTRPMLVKMAKQYRRPLLTFYMTAPPRQGDRGQDFRTLPDSHSEADDALLDVLIRDICARQGMVRAVLVEEEETVSRPFIGSKTLSDGVPAVVASIQEVLEVNLDDFRAQSSPQDGFALLRERAERAGIFVLLIGNLGSHHTNIDLQTFRGFALADEIAPFIVINDQDSKAAWSFTLLHELVHLLLGETGVSGEYAGLEIERFCNDVAGDFLLPIGDLAHLNVDETSDIDTIQAQVSEFARQRNLSSSMVAYKLYRSGKMSRDTWRHLRDVFRDLWRQARDSRRERARQQGGGPSYYVVRGHRIGRALIDLVGRMVGAGTLTTSKAGKVLGIKAKQVQILINTGEGRETHRPA